MKNIESILEESLLDVNKLDSSPFSKQGFEEFNEEIAKFVIKLYYESVKNSKREKTEVISKQQVVDAVNYLTRINRFKFKDLFNTIGGLLIGSTISFLISSINSDLTYSSFTINVHIVLGIVGSFILGFNLSKE